MNFSIFEISFVTFLVAISGAISQWPIGKLSDIYDRRTVTVYSTFAAAFFALCAIFSVGTMHLPWISKFKILVLCVYRFICIL